MIRYLLSNSLLNLIGQSLPIVIALGSLPVIYAYLGELWFALLSLVWIIIGAAPSLDFGFGRATIKFVAAAISSGERHRVSNILVASLFAQIVLGIVASVILFCAAPFLVNVVSELPANLVPQVELSFAIAGVSIPFVLFSASLLGALEADGRFGLTNAVRAVVGTFNYLIPLICAVNGYRLVEITIFAVLLRIFQAIALAYLASKHFELTRVTWPGVKNLRSLASFGKWVALSNLISLLQENVEKVFLTISLPVSLLARYSFPKELIDRFQIIPGALFSVIFPMMSSLSYGASPQSMSVFERSCRLLVMVGSFIFVSFVLIAPALFYWLSDSDLGKEFGVVLYGLAFGAMASCLNMLAVTFFHSQGSPSVVSRMQLIRLPILLPVSWYSISYFGVIGAAGSWSFGRLLALAMNYYALKNFRKSASNVEIPKEAVRAVIISFTMLTSGFFLLPWPNDFSFNHLLLGLAMSLLNLVLIIVVSIKIEEIHAVSAYVKTLPIFRRQ